MIDEILKDVDYIILVDKEKKARLDNEISEGAAIAVQLVSRIYLLEFFSFLVRVYLD